MNDSAQTTPFEAIWNGIPRRDELNAVATMDTVKFEEELLRSDQESLPRVDHLVTVGHVLGVGGNGQVVAAEQHSLHRGIAVKRPLDGETGVEMSQRLLREARVIGFLEHPNIPPVHFVGSGEDGDLLVGLKRIEGETLTDRLSRERGLENLDDNLDILVQICSAVGYAHNLGILHLDLKPDNIMTGHYGEVYVLDWGLAVAFRDDASSDLPRPPDDRNVRGTPAFLAPESVIGDRPTPATDVYQLGGVLHFMLTGLPPNNGDSAFEAIQAAYEPAPRALPNAVPPALAAICLKALAYEPADRYADADELRGALTDYRRHRREIDAVATARQETGALQRAVASEQEPAVIYRRYGATRQALDNAVRVRADEAITRPLLQQTLETLIQWELDRRNVGGADVLLSELPEPNPQLVSACKRLREQRDSEHAELEGLRKQSDVTVGTRGKVIFAVGLGLAVASLELVPFALGIPPAIERVLAGYVVYVVLVIVTSFALRKPLFRTRINRGVTFAVWQLTTLGLALRIGGYLGILPLYAVIGYDLVWVTVVNIATAAVFDRRLQYSAPLYAVAAAASFVWTDFALAIFGFAHFLGMSTLGLSMAYLPAPDRPSRTV